MQISWAPEPKFEKNILDEIKTASGNETHLIELNTPNTTYVEAIFSKDSWNSFVV